MKKQGKVRLALLWHMHQPVYALPGESEYRLPWVRMHALRGYMWMASLARKYPAIRQTVNLVPSLLAQIESYARGQTDNVERLARLDPSTLGPEDKGQILEHFFSINPRHHILPHPRYRQLLEESRRDDGLWASRNWKAGDWLDLQVWFHLSSLDPFTQMQDPLARDLLARGGAFAKGEKLALLEHYRQALKGIVPAYKALWEEDIIELSTSPYYHPILPILCDARIGRAANPALPDYDLSFRWPEDARLQLVRALEAFENWFGRRPDGVWPSEGSISEEVIRLFDSQGIRWCASDEGVLDKSWAADEGQGIRTPKHDQPFQLPDSRVAIFFRNHDLSDRLGFTYQNRGAAEAAGDFIEALLRHARPGKTSPLVSVILDGENPWEHYPHGGMDFLEALFGALSGHPDIETVTFSQAADEAETLPRLLPGSWINGNFDIWIGDVQDRNAWRLVALTRERFALRRDELDAGLKDQITELLLRAEGSDWTWWYGREHPTKDLLIFDGLLRDHLLEVFRLLGEDPPQELLSPVAGADGLGGENSVVAEQTCFIDPGLEPASFSFFAWLGAGRLEARGGGGSMHRVSGNRLNLDYGFSRQGILHLRCELPEDFSGAIRISGLWGQTPFSLADGDMIRSSGQLIARIPAPLSPQGLLQVQIALDEQRFAFSLPPADPRRIQANWLV